MAVRNWCLLGLCLLFANLSGCTFMHRLRPDQWNKLNRVPPPSLDPEFTQAAPLQRSLMIDSSLGSPAVVRAQNPL